MPETQRSQSAQPPDDDCLLVIIGATGDLTKRLLLPSLYNLACDNLLPNNFAIIGVGRSAGTTESFRDQMSKDIKTFNTRPDFDQGVWSQFVTQLHYASVSYDDIETFHALARSLDEYGRQIGTAGNILFYLATPPSSFSNICKNIYDAGLTKGDGWRRVIVEKPFGHDLPSAIELNREILRYWQENQIYRIDHYLGKETVQNILAFRFANGIFENV